MASREEDTHRGFVEEPKRVACLLPRLMGTKKQEAPRTRMRGSPVISWAQGPAPFPEGILIRVTPDPARVALAQTVVERFLSTVAGQWLIDSLCSLVYDEQTGGFKIHIDVLFVDKIAHLEIGDAAGSFFPTTRGASHYWAEVLNRTAGPKPIVSYEEFVRLSLAGEDVTGYDIRCHLAWPDPRVTPENQGYSLRVCFADDPVALMAEALFHELLHAWFIHGGADPPPVKGAKAPPSRRFPTGHKDYAKGEFEQDFHRHIEAMFAELNRPHARALEEFERSGFAK